MLWNPPPVKFRRRSERPKAPEKTAPPALMLAAATYDPDGPTVDLTFDRTINIASINAGAIVVDDGETFAQKMGGTTGSTLVNPTTVRVPLTPIGDSETAQVLLTATASSGIHATGDGGTWGGVTNVVLPFP